MKRTAAFIIFCTLLAAAVGCSMAAQSGKNEAQNDGTEPALTAQSTAPAIDIEEPPAGYTFYYESCGELKNAFLDKESEGYAELEGRIEEGSCGRYFTAFARSVTEGSTAIPAPTINGAPARLADTEEWPVVLFTKEKFGLPWIWYYCEEGGADFVAELCPLGVMLPEAARAADYGEVSKLLAPLYPTADTDPNEYADTFSAIREEDITLAGGQTVRATVLYYNDRVFADRVCYRFLLDGNVVSVRNLRGAAPFDADFWAAFGVSGL